MNELESSKIPMILGKEAGYYEFKVNNSFEIEIPKDLCDPSKIDELISVLNPTPPAKNNEILAGRIIS